MYSKFQKDGFVLAQNIIQKKNIDEARSLIIDKYYNEPNLFKKYMRVDGGSYFVSRIDAFMFNSLGEHLINENLISFLKSLLCCEELIYFGDSSVNIGESERGFHKDNIDRTNPNSPEFNPDYDIIRIGFYLQDTCSYSGGLQLRKGSHLSANKWHGLTYTALAKKGDVIIWKLTTTHSGNTLILKLFPQINIIPKVATYLPRFFFKPYEKERVAIFLAFASSTSKYLNDYMKYLSLRSDFRPFDSKKINNTLRNYLSSNGITLIDNL